MPTQNTEIAIVHNHFGLLFRPFEESITHYPEFSYSPRLATVADTQR